MWAGSIGMELGEGITKYSFLQQISPASFWVGLESRISIILGFFCTFTLHRNIFKLHFQPPKHLLGMQLPEPSGFEWKSYHAYLGGKDGGDLVEATEGEEQVLQGITSIVFRVDTVLECGKVRGVEEFQGVQVGGAFGAGACANAGLSTGEHQHGQGVVGGQLSCYLQVFQEASDLALLIGQEGPTVIFISTQCFLAFASMNRMTLAMYQKDRMKPGTIIKCFLSLEYAAL